MKKFSALLIVLMIFVASFAVVFNISKAEELPMEGSAIENLEAAISENIPFREQLSDLMSGIQYLSGVRRFGDIYIGSEGSLLKDISAPTSRTFSVAKNYILRFAEINQTKPYFMLVPTSSAVLSQEIDSLAAEDFYNQRNMITRIYSSFDGGVRTADIYQTLYDHRSEYIYYHTKDIPTSLGGYYIYGELCNRLGIDQLTLENFSAAYGARNFYGDMATDFLRPYASSDFVTFYEYIGIKDFTVDCYDENGNVTTNEDLFVYDETLFEDKTDMILGGIYPIMDIYSIQRAETRNAILIFGDESAKSWLPFLASNYERITFVDLNAASEEMLYSIETTNYEQILFAYSTATFSSGINFEKLEYIG